jgi:hypothetical protein
LQALHQLHAALLVALDDPRPGAAVATSDQRVSLRRSSHGKSNNVASICVVSSIEILSTQLNTLAARHFIEQLAGAFADDRLKIREVVRRDDRRDRLALHVMLGRIHRDEHRQRKSSSGSNSTIDGSDEKRW